MPGVGRLWRAAVYSRSEAGGSGEPPYMSEVFVYAAATICGGPAR